MAESLRTRLFRWYFNFFPAYRGTGARVAYIAGDWHEIRVRLPLSLRTRNYVGSMFGGSLYASVDPIYMIMLMKLLGPDYVVWDKAAAIRFRKPGKATLYATCTLDDTELQRIRAELVTQASLDCVYHIDIADAAGVVHAEVDKTIYVRRRAPTA